MRAALTLVLGLVACALGSVEAQERHGPWNHDGCSALQGERMNAGGTEFECFDISYQTVQDEGSAVTQRAILNFAGAGVSCADDGGTKTTCTIAGGGSGDVTDVGPGCATGACWTDGLATTGTNFAVWEGTSIDANQITFTIASNPGSAESIAVPTATGTLAVAATAPIALSAGGNISLNDDGVTYAKIQNVSAPDRVLGRSTAGAGDVEEITFSDAAQDQAADTVADDQTWVADSATTGTYRTLADSNAVDQALQYDVPTNSFSVGTMQSAIYHLVTLSAWRAGATATTTYQATTENTVYNANQTVSDELCFGWSSSGCTGGGNINFRLRDTTNAADILTGARAQNFAATIECVDPAEAMPAGNATMRLQVACASACGACVVIMTTDVNWEVH